MLAYFIETSQKKRLPKIETTESISNVCASGKENKQFNGRTIKMKEMILEERQRLRSMDPMSLIIHAIKYRKRYLPKNGSKFWFDFSTLISCDKRLEMQFLWGIKKR